MNNKANLRKFSIALLLVLLVSMFVGTAVHAREDKATVEVFPFIKPYVLIKITFPTDINGNFGGILGPIGSKYFDCFQPSSNVLICFAAYRDPKPVILTVYDKDTGEIILAQVIYPTHFEGKGEGDAPAPTGTPPPPGDDSGPG